MKMPMNEMLPSKNEAPDKDSYDEAGTEMMQELIAAISSGDAESAFTAFKSLVATCM